MTDSLTEMLRKDLHAEAGSVRPPVDIERRALGQARVIRRRRTTSVAVPVVLAVGALAVVPTVLTSRATRPPSTSPAPSTATSSTATASPSTAAPSASETTTAGPAPSLAPTPTATRKPRPSGTPAPVPSGLPGLRQVTGLPRVPFAVGYQVHFRGRDVTLPEGWSVSSIQAGGDVLVMDVYEPPHIRYAAVVRPDGSVTRLKSVGYPFALSPDGLTIAGSAAGDTPGEWPDLVVADVTRDKVLHRLPRERVPRFTTVQRLLGSEDVLIRDDANDGPAQVWSPTSGRLRPFNPPVGAGHRPLAVDRAGELFLVLDESGTVHAVRRGAAKPEWSRVIPVDSTRAVAFSPDESMIALVGHDVLRIFDARTGAPVSESVLIRRSIDPLGALWQVAWEDATTVLALDRDRPGALARCDARTSECVALTLPGGAATQPVRLAGG